MLLNALDIKLNDITFCLKNISNVKFMILLMHLISKYCGFKIYFKTDILYNICDLMYLMGYGQIIKQFVIFYITLHLMFFNCSLE